MTYKTQSFAAHAIALLCMLVMLALGGIGCQQAPITQDSESGQGTIGPVEAFQSAFSQGVEFKGHRAKHEAEQAEQAEDADAAPLEVIDAYDEAGNLASRTYKIPSGKNVVVGDVIQTLQIWGDSAATSDDDAAATSQPNQETTPTTTIEGIPGM